MLGITGGARILGLGPDAGSVGAPAVLDLGSPSSLAGPITSTNGLAAAAASPAGFAGAGPSAGSAGAGPSGPTSPVTASHGAVTSEYAPEVVFRAQAMPANRGTCLRASTACPPT